MKIDRLIGILSVLLQKEQVTAPELAERFEVSRRTISRDIEDLCKAGIPIMTMQGSGGGIRIMDGYRMDRTVLTGRDMRMILAGLRSLDSISGTSCYRQLMEKVSAGSSEVIRPGDAFLIDLSSWNREVLVPKITAVRDAVEDRKLLTFHYLSPSGESSRTIEPYYIIFKWAGWYVWGWCLDRQNYRMFKLDRMHRVSVSDLTFEPRSPDVPDLSDEKLFPGEVFVKVLFDPSARWRAAESLGQDSLQETGDGDFLFEGTFTDEDSFIGWILTFGNQAEIIEPRTARVKIREILNSAAGRYRE